MRQVKLSLLALVLVSPVVGCGGSGKVDVKELTPGQIAEQEAALKQVATSEAEHLKKSPKLEKTQTVDQEVQNSERNRQR